MSSVHLASIFAKATTKQPVNEGDIETVVLKCIVLASCKLSGLLVAQRTVHVAYSEAIAADTDQSFMAMQAEKEGLLVANKDRAAITQLHRKQQLTLEKSIEAGRQLASDIALKNAEQKALRKMIQTLDNRVSLPWMTSIPQKESLFGVCFTLCGTVYMSEPIVRA